MMNTSSLTFCGSWELVAWDAACQGLDLDRAGHTTTAVGTRLYIFGGRKGSTFHNDVLCYDAKSQKFVTPMPKCPFNARAHHSATLIEHRIWFVGGSDKRNVYNNVFVLDLSTHSWQEMVVTDPKGLLTRCAHAADLHPSQKHTIVIMGGFGAPGMDEDFQTLNDVLLLHTDSCTVERMAILDGPLPTPRAHHSMNFIGHLAFIFGGRVEQDLVPDSDPSLFCYLDLQQRKWVYPELSGSVVGDRPTTRSSHKTALYHGKLLLHGGAINQEGQDDKKERLGDMYTLTVSQGGKRLCWSTMDRPEPTEAMPKARSAHEMCILGDTLYIMLGYAGSGQGQRKDMYARDCWKLQLAPNPVKLEPKCSSTVSAAVAVMSKTAAVSPGRAAGGHAAVSGAQQTADRKRSSAGARARSKSPMGGGASRAANNAAAAASSGVWRTAKRQRSGGSGGLPAQQQQLTELAAAAAEAQPHAGQQLQPLPEQQPVQQKLLQHPQQQSPVRQQFSGLDAATAAAAAAASWAVRQGQFAPVVERCCPPSPGYSGQLEYFRHQECDHLRGQLQWQSSRVSSLEGENKQLKQQLHEVKQEKQQTEQLMQQLQGDCMRHKLSAEQATLRRQHEQEEAQLLRQQLEACKQQSRKVEGQVEQLKLQVQTLNHDNLQLQAQLSKAAKDKEQLQEQLVQQQEHQRNAEEKHAQERQAYQQTYNNLAASIEDYRNQLSKLNESIAEDKRKHEAEATKYITEAASKDLQLQERVRELLDVQQQLHNIKTVLTDEQQKADRFQQLHCSSAKEVQELQQKLTALAGDRTRLETELNKLQIENDRVNVELEKKASAMAAIRSAMLQWQGLQQNVLNALG